MTTLTDLAFAYPGKDESRKWYSLIIAVCALATVGSLYYALFVGKDLEIRFPGLFKVIIRGWLAFLIRMGIMIGLAVLTYFLGRSLPRFMLYDLRRRIVLNDEGILLPVPYDELQKEDGGMSPETELFVYYDDVRDIQLEEVDSEVTHLRFRVGEESHTIARRRLSDDEFETVCVHLVSRAGTNPESAAESDFVED